MAIKYGYHILDNTKFENLVVDLCRKLFGIGTKPFPEGRDGARDGSFEGTAELYPSKSAPWVGKTIIQAKHTNSSEASCSENKFHTNNSSVIKKEIKRLNEIRRDEYFDNYILFTNRKLTGVEHPRIIKTLRDGLGITNVEIIGGEELDLLLTSYPEIVRQYNLHKFYSPILFYETDIRDIIILFDKTDWATPAPAPRQTKFLDKEIKNQINGLSQDYFNDILENSLSNFKKIEDFLYDPINKQYLNKYLNTVSDLRGYILRNSADHNSFMELLEYIIYNIVDISNSEIMSCRRLVRIFVHFMYWHCDIGKLK